MGQSGTIPEHDRLDPPGLAIHQRTARQRAALDAQLRAACELYNAALERRRDAYRRCGESVSRGDRQAELTAMRRGGRMLTDAAADEVAAVVRASRG